MTYKVTYAIDTLDPKPTVKVFDCFDTMQDWISEERSRRVEFSMTYSPYSWSEKDLENANEKNVFNF